MDREPRIGDKIINRQTGELGQITKIDENGPCGGPWFWIEPDLTSCSSEDIKEVRYWEAIWNLEIDARSNNS